MEKQEEIISQILKIPLEEWIIPFVGSDTYEVKFSGVKIILHHGFPTKFIIIKKVRFVGEKINKLAQDLQDFQDKIAENKRLIEIDEIYNLLCTKPTN